MKKTILLLLIIYLLSIVSYAQVPDWIWAKSAGGTNNDYTYSLAVDTLGDIYVTGNYNSNTITFGTTVLTNAGMFLAKYDNNGNVLWAKNASGGNATSVAVDRLGNAYVTGYFGTSTITFGTFTLTNSGYCNIFLVKYDVSGNVLWAKSPVVASNSSITSYSIALDTLGNSYVAGYFSGSTITFGSTILTNTGQGTIFLAKYGASGNVLWAKKASGTVNDEAFSVAVDASGNSYLTGFFSSSIIFGLTTLTNTGGYDIFLTKYDKNGNVVWAKSAGGTGVEEARSVTVDALGNTYIAGFFGSTTITFGSIILTNTTNTGTHDVFLTKYDANGNVLWAKSAGGVDGDYAHSVMSDDSGNVYMAGYFLSPSIIFGSYTLTNVDNTGNTSDIFLVRYDKNGNVYWAKSNGGINNDYANCVAVNTHGIAYVAGWFNSPTISFDSNILTNTDNTGNTTDVFLAKLAAYTVITTQTNVSCYGGNNGIATANAVGGGTSPFTYLWNTIPVETTQTATGLAAGNYNVTVTDANNTSCTAGVTIIQPNEILVNNPQIICNGGNYVINGHTYISTGIYYDTLYTIHSCDSIIVTNLTVNPTYISNVSAHICQGNTYTFPDNTTSTISTIHTSHLITIHSCDSSIVTTLTVYPTYSNNVSASICQGNTYTFPDNTTSTVSTIHTSYLNTIHSCDSSIVTTLTVYPTYTNNVSAHICQGNTYTFPDNTTSTVSTLHTSHLITIHSCDSSIVTTLTVYPTYSNNVSASICQGNTYTFPDNTTSTVSTIHTSHLNTIHSCDSSILTTLTVNPLPNVTLNLSSIDTLCLSTGIVNLIGESPIGGIFNGVGVTGNNFNTATAGLGSHTISYTYLDGNSYSNTATDSIYVDACTGINEISDKNLFSIYPNPATNNITIVVLQKAIIEISNIEGQLIETLATGGTKTKIDVSALPCGVYVVHVKTEKGVVVRKFVKE